MHPYNKVIWEPGGENSQHETLNHRYAIQVNNSLYSTMIAAFSGMMEGCVDDVDESMMEINTNEESKTDLD